MNNEWDIRIFTNNFAKQMKRAGKNQKDVANALGVSAPTVHDWLKGKKMPKMTNVQKLADYFGVNLSDLIEVKDDNRFDGCQQAPATPLQLTEQEEHLVISFRCLNDDGREKAVEYVVDLTGMKKYQSDLSPVEQARRDADEIVRKEGVNPIADCNDDDYERKLPSLFSKSKKKAEVF